MEPGGGRDFEHPLEPGASPGSLVLPIASHLLQSLLHLFRSFYFSIFSVFISEECITRNVLHGWKLLHLLCLETEAPFCLSMPVLLCVHVIFEGLGPGALMFLNLAFIP